MKIRFLLSEFFEQVRGYSKIISGCKFRCIPSGCVTEPKIILNVATAMSAVISEPVSCQAGTSKFSLGNNFWITSGNLELCKHVVQDSLKIKVAHRTWAFLKQMLSFLNQTTCDYSSCMRLNFYFVCKLCSDRLFAFTLLSFVMMGCSSHVEKYIQNTPQLSPSIVLALRNHSIVNGMTFEEVKLVLGEPSFIERKAPHHEGVRWVYRHSKGVRTSEVYNPLTSFPQGIGYVIPLNYKGKEVRIDFLQGKVYRVENILSF